MDYTNILNTISSKLTELINLVSSSYDLETLIFLLLSVFLILFAMRGE